MKLSHGELTYLREVGLWVRRHRKRRNLTQDELAKALKISHQQVHSYESGKNQFPLVMLYRFIKTLDVNDIDYLFKGISYYGQVSEKQRIPSREKVG